MLNDTCTEGNGDCPTATMYLFSSSEDGEQEDVSPLLRRTTRFHGSDYLFDSIPDSEQEDVLQPHFRNKNFDDSEILYSTSDIGEEYVPKSS